MMTRSELIHAIASKQQHIAYEEVEKAVRTIVDHISQTLAEGNRVEIRGFGSFSLHYQPPHLGRNPRTGVAVPVSGKYRPYFKPGKEMRARVMNNTSAIIPAGNDGK